MTRYHRAVFWCRLRGGHLPSPKHFPDEAFHLCTRCSYYWWVGGVGGDMGSQKAWMP